MLSCENIAQPAADLRPAEAEDWIACPPGEPGDNEDISEDRVEALAVPPKRALAISQHTASQQGAKRAKLDSEARKRTEDDDLAEAPLKTLLDGKLAAWISSTEGREIIEELRMLPIEDLGVRVESLGNLRNEVDTEWSFSRGSSRGDGDDGDAHSATTPPKFRARVAVVPACEPVQQLLARLETTFDATSWIDLWENVLHVTAREQLGRQQRNGYLDILPGSKRWNAVANCVAEGGVRVSEDKTESLRVKRVQKVHNPFRELLYRSSCAALKYKPGFKGVNERWLFHGTSANSPDGVCLGSEGFDPRVCKDSNRIGRSIHFSLRANVCAVYYPHRKSETESQIILARVACGNLCSAPSFTKRFRPPPLSPENPHILYDSVLCRAKTYVDKDHANFVGVFKADQAMPDYLVTFERPQLPPKVPQQAQQQVTLHPVPSCK